MALFDVEGWDIKSQKVAFAGEKKKENKKKKAKKPKTEQGENKRRADDADAPKPKKARKTEASDAVSEEKEAPAPLPPVSTKLTPLQQKMMAKLSGSRFRWINEQLYTTTSDNALKLVEKQPSLFDEYHQGFREQVQLWPENPVDVFVDQVKSRTARPINAPGGLPGHPDKKVVIADMGCGEAQFALDVNNFVKEYNAKKKKLQKKFTGPGPKHLDIAVHSFDLKKANERITVADIRDVPLEDESCNIVIFCLALMGTNFLDFVEEAYRLLAPNGELWIAEIKSRFSESTNAKTKKQEDVGLEFVESLKLLGFYHKKTDNENKMFTRFEFFKPSREIIEQRKEKMQKRKKFVEHESKKEELDKRREQTPEGKWLLKPCIYKRR